MIDAKSELMKDVLRAISTVLDGAYITPEGCEVVKTIIRQVSERTYFDGDTSVYIVERSEPVKEVKPPAGSWFESIPSIPQAERHIYGPDDCLFCRGTRWHVTAMEAMRASDCLLKQHEDILQSDIERFEHRIRSLKKDIETVKQQNLRIRFLGSEEAEPFDPKELKEPTK